MTPVCAAVPLFVKEAWGEKATPAAFVPPFVGSTNAVAWMSLASGGTPSNSSAPRSGAVAPPLTEPAGPGRTSPSMSDTTPIAAPCDSREVGERPVLMCRFVLVVNGAAALDASAWLSFNPPAASVLV